MQPAHIAQCVVFEYRRQIAVFAAVYHVFCALCPFHFAHQTSIVIPHIFADPTGSRILLSGFRSFQCGVFVVHNKVCLSGIKGGNDLLRQRGSHRPVRHACIGAPVDWCKLTFGYDFDKAVRISDFGGR